MADQVITLRIKADGSAAITGIKSVERELGNVGRSGAAGGREAARGLGEVDAAANRTSKSLQSVKSYLLGFVGTAALAQVGRGVARMADEYTNLASRIRLVTESQSQAAAVQSEVFNIAQRSRSELRATGDLYVKLAQSTRDMGIPQERVLQMTETINKAFVVSGTGANEAAAAITQLGQGLASGALRGDEFNSVAEQAPVIMDMLAESLGVTRGELRALAADGKITAQVMVEALGNGAEDVAKKFDTMQITISGAFTQLRNSVSQYVGEATSASGASRSVAEGISAIARNIGPVLDALITLGEIAAAVYIAKLLKNGAAWIASLQAQQIEIAKTGAATEAAGVQGAAGMSKFAKGVHVAAAAVVGWEIGTYLRDQFRIVADAGDYLVFGIAQGWVEIKRAAQVQWETIKLVALGSFDLIIEGFASMVRGMADFMTSTPLGQKLFAGIADGAHEAADRLSNLFTPLDNYKSALSTIGKEYDKSSKENEQMLAIMQDTTAYTFAQKGAKGLAKELRGVADAADGASDELGDGVGAVTIEAPQIDFDPAIESANAFGDALENALDKEQAFKDISDGLREVTATVAAAERDLISAADVERIAGAASAALQSMQSLAAEGSREYEAMGLAIQAMNIVQGIAAILNQGMGDPYTAIPRMVAMAAMVAQLVDGIGSFSSSGFTDTAAQRQATQGTGTVLGDSEAKSESIANAIEITADATTELVGINRGMLNALNALVDAIGAASNMLARGADGADFSGMNLAVGENSFWTAGDIFGILGGSSKITDEGIIIFAGALQELLEGVAVGAYQEVQSRSWAFGSTHTEEGISDVSEQFATQFDLVIQSIMDTVRAGAEALGILPAEFEAALAAYQIEETRISLQDLSAEEQQAELEAVFSSIFDGLAGSVVPFIEQFQQVGEGLGETLIRIATEVQVFQESVRQLGYAFTETDPERVAQIADGLIQAAGGIEEFISGMQSFVQNFSSDGYQFQVAATALASALGQVGLSIPATRDEMFALMQSLDVTTAAGQEQVATLLRLSDVADQYYSMLEDTSGELAGLFDILSGGASRLSDFGRSLLDIRQSGEDAIAAANAIAVAQGREGASAVQLARIHQWTADQVAAAMRRLQAETQDLIAQLYGGVPGTLDAINAQISELEQSGNAIGGIANDSANLFEAWRSGIQSVQDYLDSMLLGDLSALTPEEQLAEARRQLEAAQAAALGGDVEALNNLPQLADAYLRLLRGFEASGSDYSAGFDWVRDLLQQVTGVAGPAAGGPTTTVQVTASAELQALYAQRDALLAEQELEHRRILAEQLAQNLHDLAVMLNTPILEMITLQGVSLQQLAIDLGVNLQDLTASSVQALGSMAATLGVSLGELTGSLGLTLSDLSVGLAELTGQVGIDLTNLTVESTQTLALLASSLGADLSDLATSLGVSLGALADQQSLLNQALAAEINSLPAEQSAALAPLLEAISAATTEADANTAIQALEDAVNLLAPDIRTQLAPYLADVFPADALSDLDYLGEIQSIAQDQLGVLGQINDALRASNGAAGVPGYAIGTGYVPNTGLALIHQGEGIVPAHVNDWLRTNGYPTGGGANPEIAAKLDQLIARVDQMDKNNVAATRENTQTIDQTGQRSDRHRERAMASLGPTARSTAYG